jgi:polyhydroxyalkanoate synthase subunit PhaC
MAARASGTIAAAGQASVDLLQTFFMGLDGLGVARKFRHFAALPPEDPRTALFVAVEDWLNDGVPLAGPAAQECLWRWYVENRPGCLTWELGGVRVRPERLRLPLLVVAPQRDLIVPAASAEALAAHARGASVLRPAAGHVGMVVGSGAEALLWAPLAAWLRRTAAATTSGSSVATGRHRR